MISSFRSDLTFKFHKKAFIGSILLSLLFHAIQLYFFQHQSLWFSVHSKSSSHEKSLVSVEKQERDAILKKAFEMPRGMSPIGSSSQKTSSAQPLSLAKESPLPTPVQGQIPTLLSSSLQLSLLKKDLPLPSLSFQEKKPYLPSLPDRFALIPNQDPKIDPLPASSLPIDSVFPSLQQPEMIALHASLTEKETSHPSFWEPSAKPFLDVVSSFKPSLKRSPKSISYSNEFDSELLFLEEENGKYLFAITLIPNPSLKLPSLRQNYYFLIDRSNSIQMERLQAVKNAIHRAIDELDPQDSFNILAFDSKVDKLFPTPLAPTPDAKAKANQFLNSIDLASFFSRSDLYKPLFLTVPSFLKEEEVCTAILFTDGENLKSAQMEMLLQNWSYENEGKVSLYTINLNEDAQLSQLEALALRNKGKMIASSTKRGMKRKLLKLMKTIHSPIAKNLSCEAIPTSSSNHLELLTASEQTPPLFLNEPFTILGSTDSLDDFFLFVQGRINGKWIHIKKKCSFASAKKAAPSLRNEWALQKEILHRHTLPENGQNLSLERIAR